MIKFVTTFMHKNIGKRDQFVRVMVGLILMLGAYMGVIGAWGLLGVIPFITGAFRICPLYALLHINTLKH